MLFICVLKLENDKYFVAEDNELYDYFDVGKTNDYINKYKPIEVCNIIFDITENDLDRYTKIYMCQYTLSYF